MRRKHIIAAVIMKALTAAVIMKDFVNLKNSLTEAIV